MFILRNKIKPPMRRGAATFEIQAERKNPENIKATRKCFGLRKYELEKKISFFSFFFRTTIFEYLVPNCCCIRPAMTVWKSHFVNATAILKKENFREEERKESEKREPESS